MYLYLHSITFVPFGCKGLGRGQRSPYDSTTHPHRYCLPLSKGFLSQSSACILLQQITNYLSCDSHLDAFRLVFMWLHLHNRPMLVLDIFAKLHIQLAPSYEQTPTLWERHEVMKRSAYTRAAVRERLHESGCTLPFLITLLA